MTYKGRVKDGRVVLEGDVSLPEGTPVIISVIRRRGNRPLHPDLQKITGIIPSDIDVKDEYYEAMMKKYQ